MPSVSIAFLIAVVLAGGIRTGLLPFQQLPTVPAEARLDARIPPANPAQYRAIVKSLDWRNPWLDVTNDGYRLRSISLPSAKFVAPDDLRRALTDLPVSDWPLGRVAVVQYPSIVSLNTAPVERNLDAAVALLKLLDADWWAWPP